MNAPPKPALNHDAAAWARVPRLGALLTGLAAPAAMRAAMPRARPMPPDPAPVIYPATAG